MSYFLLGAISTSAAWWPILLPLLTGATAIYLLLPQPRANRSYRVRLGAMFGAWALLFAGMFLIDISTFSVETILFYSFSSLAIFAGVLLVTQSNPARAALAFTLVVLSTCGLFLLLAAPFLMAATIIIHAGAIIVTFLFVIMLAAQSGLSDADDRSREPLLTTLTGFILLGTLLFVLQRYDRTQEIDRLLERARIAALMNSRAEMEENIGKPDDDEELFKQFSKLFRPWKDLHHKSEQAGIDWCDIKREDPHAVEKSRQRLKELIDLGEISRHRLGWLPQATDVPLSNLSGPPPSVPSENIRRNKQDYLPRMPADNAAYLGRSLFSDFLLPVELGGMLLLVATVGAIAIAFRRA
jgi:NADH-quinone oxidoreductase subunit J